MSKETAVKKYFGEDIIQWLIVFFCVLTFAGFVTSRALASIGLIGLIAVPLLSENIVTVFKQYYLRKDLVVLSVFFWIVFLSGAYSNDVTNWLNWVRIKLPYLFLPIAFASVKRLKQKKFIALLYGFILVFFISTVLVILHYTIHYTAINNSIFSGSTIPMPFSHIRFTLMLAFSFFCGVYLFQKQLFLFSPLEKWLQVFIMSFAFVSLHILSVRSGLLALYAGIFFLLLLYVFVHKKYVTGLLLFVLLASLPFVAYQLVPSLQNKLAFMQYDLRGLQQGEINYRYDVMRISSMKIGLEVWKEHKLLGVGAGDLKLAMDNTYARLLPELKPENRLMPHNQLVWVLASLGAVGFTLFLFAFLFPLFYQQNYRHWLLVVLHLIIFSSFLTEATLEEQIGTGFYITFLLVLINQFRHE